MAKWVLKRFHGGLSDSSLAKDRGDHMFLHGQGLDIRTDPDQFSALRKTIKDSGSVVVDLIKWFVMHGETLYAYGDTGKFYKRTSAGVWSVLATISDSHGNGMAVFDDYIYLASDKGLHRYGRLSGTPALETDFLVSSTEVDHSRNEFIAGTYTLQTTISEAATHKYTWVAGKDNITGVFFYLAAKGTGDWTITIHDSTNAVVASKTIANADITGNNIYVRFTGLHSLTIGGTYHIHLTSTVADGTVSTVTANDLSTIYKFSTLSYSHKEDVDRLNEMVDMFGQKYEPLNTGILETSVDRLEFVPQKKTQTAVAFIFRNKVNTGTVTVTAHDDQDNTVAIASFNANDIKVGGFYKVNWNSTWNAVVGAKYHLHINSTTGSNNVETKVASDFSTAYFKTYYQVLENDESWHPMTFYPNAQGLAIGNANYLALYDGIQYRVAGEAEGNERLQFAQEEKVRSLAIVADYLAIGVWQGDGIQDQGRSRLYFWNGILSEPQSTTNITGEVNAMITSSENVLEFISGGTGRINVYSGRSHTPKVFPNVGKNKYIEVYPGAMTVWEGLTYIGISGGDSTTMYRGVYSWGKKTTGYDRALNFDYPISTGTVQGTTVQIGSIFGAGTDKFFISWKDGATYGVDKVSTTEDQQTVIYESIIHSSNAPFYEKRARSVKGHCTPLVSGQSIVIKYKIDRATSWTTLGTKTYSATEPEKNVYFSFPFTKRFREIQLRIELVTTGNTAPAIDEIVMFYEEIKDEQEL